MKKVLGRVQATSLLEMVKCLMDLQPLGVHAETVYVTINSDAVRMTLIEETLTDGSVVYNIELDEVTLIPIDKNKPTRYSNLGGSTD